MSSSFLLGAKVLTRLCQEQNAYKFYQSKLTEGMFKGDMEVALFKFVTQHYNQFHVLPSLSTLTAQFSEVGQLTVPEPSSYYLHELDTRYGYDLLTRAAQDSNTILKANQKDIATAESALRTALAKLAQQKYRSQILDVGPEAPELVLANYHPGAQDAVAHFGWPYLDDAGGVLPGSIASFVGRPSMGKSYQMLWGALYNWRERKQNVLFVSMEMMALEVAQRVTAMYAKTNVGQLQKSGYSTKTLHLWAEGVKGMNLEPAHFYVMEGNLAVDVDSIYNLAATLDCKIVFIDGAYMVRSSNPRLDRYTRVAENVEHMKRTSTSEQMATIASWQFAKTAVTKKNKNSKAKEGLEDIAYSDAIGQVSSIVIGLMQEEGVETLEKRKLTILKGRSGQTGEFEIHWQFDTMDFTEIPTVTPKEELEHV